MTDRLIESIAKDFAYECLSEYYNCCINRTYPRAVLTMLGFEDMKFCPFKHKGCGAITTSDWYDVLIEHTRPINPCTFVKDVNATMSKLHRCPICKEMYLPDKEEQLVCNNPFCKLEAERKSNKDLAYL